MEKYRFKNGTFSVHSRNQCWREVSDNKDQLGNPCVIHRPSNHHMRTWPMILREYTRVVERECAHGVGHPDPDSVAWFKRRGYQAWAGRHGCDGCCNPNQKKESTTNMLTREQIIRAYLENKPGNSYGGVTHARCFEQVGRDESRFTRFACDFALEAIRFADSMAGVLYKSEPATKVAVRFVPSSTEKGVTYEVTTMSDGTVTCTCVSGKIRKSCKHMDYADKSAITTLKNAPRAR